ncbi:MAG: PHP domain-containing protein [Rhodanobacter sp.]|nr:MAG: PHP domain-containing protein [Rhodanobacter sp.]
MSIRNAEIAAMFEEIAELLELQQANAFRVRAYRNAARTLAAWPEEMADWGAQGRDFDDLPGVGKDLAGKIAEILARGSCDQLDRLRASFPRGITDHSRSLTVAHGLDARRLGAQIDAIDRLNEKLKDIVLLKGIEVDILPDGRLDLPDAVLARLDLVVGAVHSSLDLSRERQTARILHAMDRPNFSILAHPNGRLFGTRGPCALDMERIIRHARERGCFLELNSQPDRLDLFDLQCRQARDTGVAIAISSDAHHGTDLRWLALGVDQARRGWLEAGDVLNTLPLRQLRKRLAATMSPPRG